MEEVGRKQVVNETIENTVANIRRKEKLEQEKEDMVVINEKTLVDLLNEFTTMHNVLALQIAQLCKSIEDVKLHSAEVKKIMDEADEIRVEREEEKAAAVKAEAKRK